MVAAMKRSQPQHEEMERTDDAMRQEREDIAAIAYHEEMRIASEHQLMLSRLEDARQLLRENDPTVAAAEVAAAQARTTALASVLPGTAEEITQRLLANPRAAALGDSAAPDSHTSSK